MSIWNLNVNCGITFGEDSRLTVGEKLKSYGATTALLLYDMAMDQFGYQREIEKVINDANIKVVCYQVEEGEPTAQKSDRAYDFAKDKSVDAIVAIGGGSTMDTGKMVGKSRSPVEIAFCSINQSAIFSLILFSFPFKF